MASKKRGPKKRVEVVPTFGKANCKHCGKEFQKTQRSNVFCQDKALGSQQHCSRLYAKSTRKKKIIKRICLTCKNIFESRHGGQKYCLAPCSSLTKEELSQSRFTKRETTCDLCRKPYVMRSPRHKRFCNSPCTYALWRRAQQKEAK